MMTPLDPCSRAPDYSGENLKLTWRDILSSQPLETRDLIDQIDDQLRGWTISRSGGIPYQSLRWTIEYPHYILRQPLC